MPERERRPHFRVAGIPIRIDPSFFLIVVLLGASGGTAERIAIFVVVVFVSVILHELGHALVSRRFGYSPNIELHLMGGTTFTRSAERIPPKRSLLITLAGPGAGLVLGGITLAIALAVRPVESEVGRALLTDLLWVNIVWSILNLVPLLPLDGGLVMIAFLDIVTGGRGEVPGRIVSLFVAAAAIVLAVANGFIFPAVFVGLFAAQNAAVLWQVALRRGDRPLMDRVAEVGRALDRGDLDGAVRRGKEVLSSARAMEVRVAAAQAMAAVQQAMFDGGRFMDAADLGGWLFERRPDPLIAYNVACSWLRAGRHDEGILWLTRAVEAGFSDLAELDRDPDLEPIRGTPSFEDLRRRLGATTGGPVPPEPTASPEL